MREIKFRAWDKEEKFMLQDIQSMYDGSCNHKETEERYGWISCFDSFIDDDNYVVMQYTGLKDKNGTEIYEGDIVTTDLKRPYLIVEFRDGCFMFNCNDGGEDYYDIMLPIMKEPKTIYKYGEVIGNIHDNPELLGGAK